MALATDKPAARVPLETAVRNDTWWVKPLLTVLGLSIFAIWATFRAFENRYYHPEPYLSPFYSPLLPFEYRINGWLISPAFYILVFPLAFRMTCYYYRQAYYRSFFMDPLACAVPEPKARTRYQGERQFPFTLQNLHRYALYFALLFLVFLWYDVLKAFWFDGRFGIGVGSLIILANVVLLTGYTFGCHSLRHLVGGKKDCFSCPAGSSGESQADAGYKCWRTVSMFNRNHMQWAWSSLASVVLTDLYIRSVATGAITDLRIIF